MRIKNENLIALGEKQEPLSALEQLEQLIPVYALNKSELDSYKKLCDAENSEIKKLMSDLDITEKAVGNYIAKKTVTKRETINEDILISLFTSVPGFVKIADECGIVKTKEYIDYDALESAIYNDKLSPEMVTELNRARESKEVITLKVTKQKKKKEEE